MTGRHEPRWIPDAAIRALHADQLREHGGRQGIRDEGLLSSALARPRQLYHYGESADLFVFAAAYAFGIARNHPFVDGNKRTAFVTAAVFLYINGLRLAASEPETVDVMLRLAAGEVPEDELAAWLRANSEARRP